MAFWHRVQIPYLFQQLSNIVSGSPIVSETLQHYVWIPHLFDRSPILCLDPLSFRPLFCIVSGPPIVSMALWHRVWIPYIFLRLFSIVLRSPIFLIALRHCYYISYRFDDSLASCLDPLYFWWLYSIVHGSLIFLAVLQLRV